MTFSAERLLRWGSHQPNGGQGGWYIDMVEYQLIETDVLVVGAGGAGCRAAMAAADAGARVVLIEKGRLGVTGNTFDPFCGRRGV
jgi:NADPH-dependent glutamate synthase beta subunit-like oxidoreductase